MAHLNWKLLPKHLRYIADVAQRYMPEVLSIKEMKEHVGHLPPAAIAALARLYRQIEARGDGPRFYRWHADEFQRFEERDRRPPEALLTLFHITRELFHTFEILAERKIEPFVSRTVVYDDLDEKLDWSKLPKGLEYLIAPAEEYGDIQFDDQIDEFVKNVTPEQRAELTALAEEIKRREDNAVIRKWLDAFPTTDHPEASRIAWTINLFQALGIDF
jgi:hypothetical protein